MLTFFIGMNDFEKFFKMAQEEGFVINARIGPFTAAEREGGGLPWWLYRINPKMRVRTSDPTFLAAVDKWYMRISCFCDFRLSLSLFYM